MCVYNILIRCCSPVAGGDGNDDDDDVQEDDEMKPSRVKETVLCDANEVEEQEKETGNTRP